MTRDQRKVLKDLKDEVVLPMDKENATIVLRQVEKNPTTTQENRLSHTLKVLEKCREIPEMLYRRP